jgi:hypothetical protein
MPRARHAFLCSVHKTVLDKRGRRCRREHDAKAATKIEHDEKGYESMAQQRASQPIFRGMYNLKQLAKLCTMPVPAMRAFLKQYSAPLVREGEMMLLRSDELRSLREAVYQRTMTPPPRRPPTTRKQAKPSRRGTKKKPEPDNPGPHVG